MRGSAPVSISWLTGRDGGGAAEPGGWLGEAEDRGMEDTTRCSSSCGRGAGRGVCGSGDVCDAVLDQRQLSGFHDDDEAGELGVCGGGNVEEEAGMGCGGIGGGGAPASCAARACCSQTSRDLWSTGHFSAAASLLLLLSAMAATVGCVKRDAGQMGDMSVLEKSVGYVVAKEVDKVWVRYLQKLQSVGYLRKAQLSAPAECSSKVPPLAGSPGPKSPRVQGNFG